ncbi:hypothetical protein F4801DRAFT_570146 [Xylaria longipes]|nr:hypothetical protein F4801DRAFT_570146 [Xylaria longipes]
MDIGGVAALGGFFLSGAMMNIAILDVPVLLEVSHARSSDVLNHWGKLYEYGARLYPSISVTVGLLYLYAILSSSKLSSRRSWIVFLVAAGTTLAMIPWTLLVMMPTNDTLMRARDLAGESKGAEVMLWEEVEGLVVHWQRLHFLRSLFPLVGSVIGVMGITL